MRGPNTSLAVKGIPLKKMAEYANLFPLEVLKEATT